ncbi:MAG: reverse transcriptase/maturase family protein [Candidatus Paceibacterota bacterium]
MKSFNNLFGRISSFENIHLAYLKARRNKRYKKDVLRFSSNLEENLFRIKKDLTDGSYRHSGYKEFVIRDSKKRRIKAPDFRDRVVHHALCNIIEPIFDRTFTFDSYACRKGKGTHRAVKRLKYFLKKEKGLYCYKCDISRYFDSIDHGILFSIIQKKIRDEKTLRLIKEIIGSSFSREGKGIPIGNLTSQLFANIYLGEFGHFAKNVMREKMCLRYMDDFLFMGRKHRLRVIARKTISFLSKKLKLKVNPKKNNIFPADKGIDFLGYVIFNSHILLRKNTVKRFLEKRGDVGAFSAYARHADSYVLGKKLGFW